MNNEPAGFQLRLRSEKSALFLVCFQFKDISSYSKILKVVYEIVCFLGTAWLKFNLSGSGDD